MDTSQKLSSRKREFIERVWHELEATSVGRLELKLIHDAIVQEFGVSHPGPAAIARILADNGAQLRHPEILRADCEWRAGQLFELFAPDELNFGSLEEAETSLSKLEDLRVEFETISDAAGLQQLRTIVLAYKRDLQMIELARLGEKSRAAREIVLWLTVWLQDPGVFANWLDLRQNSPEFRRDFRE
jgi:hypothetical protein